MARRKGLLGLAAAVAAVGLGADKPPGLPADPRVEGREPNPVVREFHQADPATPDYGAGPVPPARAGAGDYGMWTGIMGVVWEAMLDHFTMPLGTVPMLGLSAAAPQVG
jgi:hypothetical protein